MAIINAYNDCTYGNVVENAKAIVFLGTPHRGADLDGLLSSLFNITLSRRLFVDQLRANSEMIQEINDAFRDRSESLQLISYYESKAMRGDKVRSLTLSDITFQVIVSKDSATLGFPRERSSPLNGNHLEISKFYSKEDDNYVRVARNISKLNESVRGLLKNGEGETFIIPYQQNPRFAGGKCF